MLGQGSYLISTCIANSAVQLERPMLSSMQSMLPRLLGSMCGAGRKSFHQHGTSRAWDAAQFVLNRPVATFHAPLQPGLAVLGRGLASLPAEAAHQMGAAQVGTTNCSTVLGSAGFARQLPSLAPVHLHCQVVSESTDLSAATLEHADQHASCSHPWTVKL